jgi:5,10-methylenetetrahydromethanopterin reductase
MSSTPSLGAVFPARAPVETLPAFARQLEAGNIDELWVVEDCFLSGGLTMAATALAVTDRLRVGVGLLPATVRNPAIAAMEIATLARLHPGRFATAFGHGVAEWMRQIDAAPPKRLAALEEVVVAVRALLAGDTVTTSGSHVRLDRVLLERPPESIPPVLVGTTGPKGLELAGRCADGFLLPEGCGPDFTEWAVKQAWQGSDARNAKSECVVYAWLRIEDDPARTQSVLRSAIEGWLSIGLFPEAYRQAGVDPALRAPPPVDQLVQRLAVAGDPQECADALGRFANAGADSVILVPVGAGIEQQMDRLTREVLPALRGSTSV